MLFDQQKKDCLNRIDKSIKKSIDKEIKSLVNLLNSLKDYYTTSSCSGRILLINKKTDKKQDIKFVFVEHKKTNFKDIKKSLQDTKNNIWLRQESIILHVCCRNIEAAKKLLKIARDSGIKRAGIININKRIIIEIIGTESMETIITKNSKIVVDDTYLRILIGEANKKLEKNRKKINKLYKVISSSV
jgi:tRNA wybutosine-synthesizing protein 3